MRWLRLDSSACCSRREIVPEAGTGPFATERLAKSVKQGALDQDLTKEDVERLLAFLRTFGDLKQDLAYQGSQRAGVSRLPGAGDVTETLRPPLEMHSLLDANFWGGVVFEESFDQQMPMFQAVGGMDHIPY